jgi:hypothetical protein
LRLSLSHAGRVVFFFCVPEWKGVYFYVRLDPGQDPITLEALHVLAELPTMLYLAIYSQQLLTWAKSFHVGRGDVDTYHFIIWRVVIFGNALAWVLQIALWAVRGVSPTALDAAGLSLAASSLNSVCFLAILVGIVTYGVRLTANISSTPLGLDLRSSGVTAVVRTNAVLSVTFFIRLLALLVISWVAYIDINGFDERFDGADVALSLCFFIFTEIVPLSAVLWWQCPLPRRTKRGAPLVRSPRSARSPRGPGSLSPRSIASNLRAERFSSEAAAGDVGFRAARSDAAVDSFGSAATRAAQARTSVAGALWALLQIAFFGVAAVGGAAASAPDTERTPLVARAPSPVVSSSSGDASSSLEAARAAALP